MCSHRARTPLWGRAGYVSVLGMSLFWVACNAQFIDLRPESERSGPATQEPEPTADGAERGDAGQSPGEILLARGRFEGRAGHGGSGGAALYRVGDAVELRFDGDFTVSAVPGPAIFLTSRADMGGSIDAQADIKLGNLTAFNGAQRIAVPAGADTGRRSVFVYCQPFRVEVAKAALTDVPQ